LLIRFKILPKGVVSKNDIGDFNNEWTKESWNFKLALKVPHAKMKPAAPTAMPKINFYSGKN
jgi:hypothetical protein